MYGDDTNAPLQLGDLLKMTEEAAGRMEGIAHWELHVNAWDRSDLCSVNFEVRPNWGSQDPIRYVRLYNCTATLPAHMLRRSYTSDTHTVYFWALGNGWVLRDSVLKGASQRAVAC
jgi:hypothetical protein